ncbi:MAG: hypothetical protein WA871_12655 [Candidatus Acidiferrales bacterium]
MSEQELNGGPVNVEEPLNPTVLVEAKDVSVSGIEHVGVWLIVVILLVLAVAGGAYKFLTRVQPLGTPEIAAGVTANGHNLPPAPRMQGIPGDTVPPPEQQREFQNAAAAKLDSYGWVDSQHTVAHIPIADAMQDLVKNGLPQPMPQVAARSAQPAASQAAARSKPQADAVKGKKGQ